MKEFLKIFAFIFTANMFVLGALSVIENPYLKIIGSLIISGLSLLIFVYLKFRNIE